MPTPEDLWGPDYRKHLQRQFDIYDAAVAREQAEIEASKAGKPIPPPAAAPGLANPVPPPASEFPPRPALDPANFPPLPELGPLPEEEPRPKRELHGPKVIMQPPAEPRYLVNGLFAASSLNLLVGDPGHKKSILAIDLALSVAMGKPWLGQPVSQSAVVLVEEESGLTRLLKRLHSAFLGHGANEETPFHFISMGNFDFRDVQEAIDLSEHAHSVNANLIVIDALANVMVGGDENSVLSTQPILRNLRALAVDCDAAVVIVHHNNKSGGFRGSTTLQAGVDHMLSVYSPPGQNLIRLSTLKSRDLEPITLHARAHFEPDRFYLTPTDERFPPHLSKVERAVLAFIGEQESVSTHNIQTSLDFTSPGNIRTALHNLKGSKYIQRINGDKRGEKAVFQLTEKGQSLVKELDNDSNP